MTGMPLKSAHSRHFAFFAVAHYIAELKQGSRMRSWRGMFLLGCVDI